MSGLVAIICLEKKCLIDDKSVNPKMGPGNFLPFPLPSFLPEKSGTPRKKSSGLGDSNFFFILNFDEKIASFGNVSWWDESLDFIGGSNFS